MTTVFGWSTLEVRAHPHFSWNLCTPNNLSEESPLSSPFVSPSEFLKCTKSFFRLQRRSARRMWTAGIKLCVSVQASVFFGKRCRKSHTIYDTHTKSTLNTPDRRIHVSALLRAFRCRNLQGRQRIPLSVPTGVCGRAPRGFSIAR